MGGVERVAKNLRPGATLCLSAQEKSGANHGDRVLAGDGAPGLGFLHQIHGTGGRPWSRRILPRSPHPLGGALPLAAGHLLLDYRGVLGTQREEPVHLAPVRT